MPIEYPQLGRILTHISSKFFNVKHNFLYNQFRSKSHICKQFGLSSLHCNSTIIRGGKAAIISTIGTVTLYYFVDFRSFTCTICETSQFDANNQQINDEDDNLDDDSLIVTFNRTNIDDEYNHIRRQIDVNDEIDEYVSTVTDKDLAIEDLDTFDESEILSTRETTFEKQGPENNKTSDNSDDVIVVTHVTRPIFSDNPLSSINELRVRNSSNRGFKLPDFFSGLFNLFSLEDDGENFITTYFSPKKFLFYTCGTVFLMWAIAENSKNTSLLRFMRRHFIASSESLNSKRYHTLFTAGISHSSFLHLTLNMMMLNMILDEFSKSRGIVNMDFNGISKFFSNIIKGYGNFPTFNLNNSDYVTNFDIYTSFWLSTFVSSLGHSLLYGSPVLGASGGISGLMYLMATTSPNSTFRTIFPIPGIKLSALQIMQVFIAMNLFFITSKRFHTNIAWAAHLFGVATGIVYCWVQRNIFDRQYFKSFTKLSSKYSLQQWSDTLHEIRDRIHF
ncbi:Rhomboid-like protease 6 [Babesia microti strain RI]|uniref:Rhomboid-like protease 6 n=1 Tax=Babesia microti (strain RI) TaxID=1133968 RepID=A0A1R4AB05_BABMR|nr:Rhomboid-like protease 6 [Babesia microti strain RI]SJK86167.1 Rhomboid-like protease 6 [Babesia microti strain RI]|eukprot:XP_021338360.1 Rhomboid-like protease 6 [Babesia microti strain RI]